MRGEFRAVNLAVTGPEVALGLDRQRAFRMVGRRVPTPRPISMDRVTIEDGRADALRCARRRHRRRSKSSPSAAICARSPVPPRVTARSTSRASATPTACRRTARPPTARSGSASRWTPRTSRAWPTSTARSGSSAACRTSTPTCNGRHGFGRASAGEPFRVTGHVRGTSAAVAVDKVELQYGPDERAARLHGDANLTLGAEARARRDAGGDPDRPRPAWHAARGGAPQAARGAA